MLSTHCKLILINGQGAAGKSTLARLLNERLANSVRISGDAVMSVNPFELNDNLYTLAFKNVRMLMNNFIAAGYSTIIVPGTISSQALLNQFLKETEPVPDMRFIWLRAEKEVRNARRMTRSRDDADTPEYFDFLDRLIPDVEIKAEKYLTIDTSQLTPQEIADKAIPFVE